MSGDLSHELLYGQIMAGRPDLIEEAGAFWPLLGKDFALLATKLGEEVTRSRDFWTGSAAENFRGTLTHLAGECRRFDQQTQETHRVIASYAARLREAQRVVPRPEAGAPAVVTDGGVGAWQAGQAHAQAQAAENEARRVHDWISHHATEHSKQFAVPEFRQDRVGLTGPGAGTEGYYAGSPNAGTGSGARGSYGTPGITWASGGTSAAPGTGGETDTDLTGGPKATVPPGTAQPVGPGSPSTPRTGSSGPGGYVPGLPPATGVGAGSGSVGTRPGTSWAGSAGGGRVGSGGIAGVVPGATGGQRSTGGLPHAGATAGASGAGRGGTTGTGAAGAGMGGMPMGGTGGGATDNGNTRSPRPTYLREDPETWDVQKKGNPMVIE